MHITSAARPGRNTNSFSKLSSDSSSPWLDEDAYTFEFVQFVLVLSKCEFPWAHSFKQDSYFFSITSPNERTGTECPTTLPINHCKRQHWINASGSLPICSGITIAALFVEICAEREDALEICTEHEPKTPDLVRNKSGLHRKTTRTCEGIVQDNGFGVRSAAQEFQMR